jgi:hypothetical protein
MRCKSLVGLIKQQYMRKPVVSSLFMAFVILEIDYITGSLVQFPATYVLPIGMAAWRHKVTAYILSILMPFCRFGFYFAWHNSTPIQLVALNLSIVVLSLLFYTYLIDRIAWQNAQLERKVKVLEGILPVCASCGRIRNSDGQYEGVQKYITEHSEASFSHGLCPECAKKLYPEFYNEKES